MKVPTNYSKRHNSNNFQLYPMHSIVLTNFEYFDQISNWLTRPEKKDETGFLQHKPVCYTSPDRGRGDGTYVRGYSLSNADTLYHLLNDSIMLSYFGSAKMMSLRMYGSNFSFGLSEDGTFTKFNYTVW